MTAEALTYPANLQECDPLRDLRHREARAARDLADWLAWLELGLAAFVLLCALMAFLGSLR